MEGMLVSACSTNKQFTKEHKYTQQSTGQKTALGPTQKPPYKLHIRGGSDRKKIKNGSYMYL